MPATRIRSKSHGAVSSTALKLIARIASMTGNPSATPLQKRDRPAEAEIKIPDVNAITLFGPGVIDITNAKAAIDARRSKDRPAISAPRIEDQSEAESAK